MNTREPCLGRLRFAAFLVRLVAAIIFFAVVFPRPVLLELGNLLLRSVVETMVTTGALFGLVYSQGASGDFFVLLLCATCAALLAPDSSEESTRGSPD